MNPSAAPLRPSTARPTVRATVEKLPESKVRELANAGFGRTDLRKFWFGESPTPTPDYIRQAAIQSLMAGETFYAHNNGRPELRRALSDYLTDLHGVPVGSERVSVTSSGVSALAIAMQAILDPGDRVVIVTPIWPNVAAIPSILGAEVVRAPLDATEQGWRLDLDRLLRLVTPETRLLVINSPGNPTGWMLSPEQRRPILEHCRRLGVWLLTDDVYERLVFDDGARAAPSFLPLITPDDRVIGANSFSKAWLMTGWRLGWLTAPAALETDIGKLIEFNTSCAPGFVQAAGIAALEQGEPHVSALRRELAANCNEAVARLRQCSGVEAPRPQAGMYVFFRLQDATDPDGLAHRLMSEAALGLAPGLAFGPEGSGWLRWCIAAPPAALDDGLARFERWVARGQA